MPPQYSAASVPHHQYAWFVGAPLSKVLAVGTAASYVAAHARDSAHQLLFDGEKIIYGGERYRYATSKLAFGTSAGTFAMGTLLLIFVARKLEREMGSRKFFPLVLFVNLTSICIEHLFLLNVSYSLMSYYSGPYALLGALFYLFHTYQPRLHPRFFGVLGFWFSEKSFYYVWFLQIAGGGSWKTLIPTAIGWLSAVIWRKWVADKVDVPDVLVRVFSPLAERLAEPPPRILVPSSRQPGGLVEAGATGGLFGGNHPSTAQQQRGGGTRTAAAAHRHPVFGNPPAGRADAAGALRPPAPPARRSPPPEPDPAAMEQLLMMGFDRQEIVQALQFANNDVQRAADRLLAQHAG